MIFRKARDQKSSTLLIEIREQLLIFSRKKKDFDREARIKINNFNKLCKHLVGRGISIRLTSTSLFTFVFAKFVCVRPVTMF